MDLRKGNWFLFLYVESLILNRVELVISSTQVPIHLRLEIWISCSYSVRDCYIFSVNLKHILTNDMKLIVVISWKLLLRNVADILSQIVALTLKSHVLNGEVDQDNKSCEN